MSVAEMSLRVLPIAWSGERGRFLGLEWKENRDE